MNYSETLRGVLVNGQEPQFKGSATKDQAEAFVKAGESYADVDRSNVGGQTKLASQRVATAYESAAKATVDAEVEATKAAEVLKTAREQHAAELKAVKDKLAADVESAKQKDVLKAAEEKLAELKKPDAKTAADVISAKQKEVTDLKASIGTKVKELETAATEQTQKLASATKEAHKPLEEAASKTARKHARLEKRTGQIANVEHKFNRGDVELKASPTAHVAAEKPRVVDGKELPKYKADKVANDPKVAKAYKEVDGAFDAVVDKSKLGATPKYASVATTSFSGSASSLAEAHKVFNPFDGISAEGLKGDKIKPLHDKFHEALAAVEKEPEVAGKLNTLKSAHGQVKAFEAAKTAETDAGFKAAKEALGKAQKEVDEALKVTEKSSQAVKDFAAASKNAGKLQGYLGNYHAQGALGAAKSNLYYKSVGNTGGKVFGRVAAMGVGAGLTLHAFQAKTSDGQERSWVTRTTEVVTGLGLLAGGAVMGKARI